MKLRSDIPCGNCKSHQTYEAAPGVLWCSDCGAVLDTHSLYIPERWQAPTKPRAHAHIGGVGMGRFILEPVSPGVGRVIAEGDCTGRSAQLGDLVYFQVAVHVSGVLRWEPAFRWGVMRRDGTWRAWVSYGSVTKSKDLGVFEIDSVWFAQAKVSGGHVFHFRTESGGAVTITFKGDEL